VSEPTVGVKEKAEPIVSGGALHDLLTDANASSVRKLPVHPENVVAKSSEAARAGGVIGGAEMVEERGCRFELKGETQVSVTSQANHVLDRLIGRNQNGGIDGIEEGLEETFSGGGSRPTSHWNLLSSSTFMGLRVWWGLNARGIDHCMRMDSGPNTRGM
jgi:hypothetical protein